MKSLGWGASKSKLCMEMSIIIRFFVTAIAYPEFPFESEAKGDNLIGVHQTRTVKNWKGAYNFNSWLWEYCYTRKEAKGLNNRYCVKFTQFGIGLLGILQLFQLTLRLPRRGVGPTPQIFHDSLDLEAWNSCEE